MISRALPPYKASFIRCLDTVNFAGKRNRSTMFVSLVFFSLLFAGRAVCDDWFEEEEEEDEENFAMVSTQIKDLSNSTFSLRTSQKDRFVLYFVKEYFDE